MNTIKISTSQHIDIDFEIAGLAERIWARLIDLGIFFLIFLLLLAIQAYIEINRIDSDIPIIILFIVASLYPFLMEVFFNGQSIGKKVLKIKVISLDGNQPTLGQYAIRWVSRLIDFTVTFNAAGLVCVAMSDKNQRIGDILAHTTVIKTKPRTQFEDLYFTTEQEETYVPLIPEAQQVSNQDIYLINDVLKAYYKTVNYDLVTSLEEKMIKKYEIKNSANLKGTKFLETLVKDYNHFGAISEG